MKKALALLGASGSIGRQTVEIVEEHPESFSLVAVSVHQNLARLQELLRRHPSIRYACLTGSEIPVSTVTTHPEVVFFSQSDGLQAMLHACQVDMVVNAITGFAGLAPTLTSLECGMDVALANKESLVTGGELVRNLLTKTSAKLYPVDSEHSALAQCLAGEDITRVAKLILTASGGPFRDTPLSKMAACTVEEALHHPTWSMGPKITIDSATLMNKGFEIIEAHHLFQMPYDRIEVVIHRESIIHSMVEFQDGVMKAQLGVPSMKTPLLYALNECSRPLPHHEHLSLHQALALHFEPVDMQKFPALQLAFQAGIAGGSAPTVLNAANEVAVAACLAHQLPFPQIVEVVARVMKEHRVQPVSTYEDIQHADAWARVETHVQMKILKEELV
ncbi:MAG: 1-deoxy-D-xylulose-5-phosphate reductoisomerase [Bacilli bacterium]